MTRKRFVKLFMARGVQRNKAVLLADEWNHAGVSYETAWKFHQNYRPLLSPEYVRQCYETIRKFCDEATKAIVEFINSIAKGIKEVFDEIS